MSNDDVDDIFGAGPASPVPSGQSTPRPVSPFGQDDTSADALFGSAVPKQPGPAQPDSRQPAPAPETPIRPNTADDAGDLFEGWSSTESNPNEGPGPEPDTGQAAGQDAEADEPQTGRRFGRKKNRSKKTDDEPSAEQGPEQAPQPAVLPPAVFTPAMVAPAVFQPAHQPEPADQSGPELFGFNQPSYNQSSYSDDEDDADGDGASSVILRKVVPTVAGVALLIGACVGIWNVLPDEKAPEPAAASATPVADPTSISVKAWDGDGPATFAPVALNSMPIPETSVVAPTEHGLVIINDKKLAVYESGQRISAVMSVPEAVKFVLPTQINGVDFLVWRAGDVLYFWSPDTPTVAPVEQNIGANATVSSAGRSILIQMGSDTFVTDTKNYTKVTKPTRASAAVPMSFDGTTIAAGDPNGALWLIGLDGQAESLELQPPDVGAKPAKWVTSGHGLAVSLWRKSGDPRVLVAVHSTKDGTLLSVTPADQAAVSGQQWIRGQAFKKAAFGPLEFDMETGELVFDGTKSGVQFTRPFGDVAPGVSAEGDVIVAEAETGHTAWTGGATVIGVDAEDNAIVRSDDKKSLSFHAKNG